MTIIEVSEQQRGTDAAPALEPLLRLHLRADRHLHRLSICATRPSTRRVPYVNSEVGIRALYPQHWLIDTSGDYVFRVRDLSQLGFKTTIQVRCPARDDQHQRAQSARYADA